MTERLWVFSFLSLSSANRSSPFVWKNDQQRVRYSLHRRVDTHTNTKKRGNKISATTCVIVCIRELGCLDQTKQKMCLLWNVLWGPIRSHSKKKKKNVGIPKRKKRKWSISQSQIPWKKEKVKKIPSQQHRQSATLFLLLLSFFRVYWKIYVSKDPPKKGVIP